MLKRLACALPMAAAALTFVVAAPAGAVTAKPAAGKPSSSKKQSLLVCRRGCPYSSIQKAANAAKKGQTIRVKPGVYVEGVTLKGAAKDGVKLVGLGATPGEVVLEGKGAKGPGGAPAQNGIFADGADGVVMRNMTARNFPANGFFVRDCDGYLMDRVRAENNRAYGLYAFNCVGGRMTYSVGFGHGDSAFYVGQTPPQERPKKTLLDHLEGYENVLGYSGTNSKYVEIRNSEFYNNGAGVVPNTLQSEKFPPALDGLVTENLIYWNNFNYFRSDSKVKPLPAATGGFNYPTGAGVVLFGTTGWEVRNNLIFGNFKWGVMSVSDPTYAAATNRNNKVRRNIFGAWMDDPNAVDVFSEGSGSGNCWEANQPGATYDTGALPEPLLYPTCSNPQNTTDPVQLAELADYLTKKEEQEQSWIKRPHPPRPDRTPIDGQGG